MGLGQKAAAWYAQRWIRGARQGKEGQRMKNVWKALDGRKRFVVLLATIVVAVLKASGVGDYEGILGMVLRFLDYTPETLPIPAGTIALVVSGGAAIGHALIKAWRKADSVSIPR